MIFSPFTTYKFCFSKEYDDISPHHMLNSLLLHRSCGYSFIVSYDLYLWSLVQPDLVICEFLLCMDLAGHGKTVNFHTGKRLKFRGHKIIQFLTSHEPQFPPHLLALYSLSLCSQYPSQSFRHIIIHHSNSSLLERVIFSNFLIKRTLSSTALIRLSLMSKQRNKRILPQCGHYGRQGLTALIW